MGFLCKGNGDTQEITWKNINDAYVSAITVCQYKLDSTLRQQQNTNSVLVLGAINEIAWILDVKTKLMTTNYFDNIDIFNVINATPSLKKLQEYDAVLLFTDYDVDNPELMGDILADYVDSGHGVVTTVFENNGNTSLTGRWMEESYDPIISEDQHNEENLTLGEVILPNHPIMLNINSFDGGTASFHGIGDIAENSIEIAQWSNGRPLVAERLALNARVIMLNFYPPSMDVREDFWDTSTDGALLMGNALKYVMG